MRNRAAAHLLVVSFSLLLLAAPGRARILPSAHGQSDRRQLLAITAPFSVDSTHRSNVHDASPPPRARSFSIPLSKRTTPSVSKRGGELTFLWGDGEADPNPLWDAEMNFALFQGTPGNIRELHWHPDAAEWAQVLDGTCFTTMMDPEGKIANNQLGTGDVWYFPRNWPHAVQVRTARHHPSLCR